MRRTDFEKISNSRKFKKLAFHEVDNCIQLWYNWPPVLQCLNGQCQPHLLARCYQFTTKSLWFIKVERDHTLEIFKFVILRYKEATAVQAFDFIMSDRVGLTKRKSVSIWDRLTFSYQERSMVVHVC